MASNRVKSQGAKPSTPDQGAPQDSTGGQEPEELKVEAPEPAAPPVGADPLADVGAKMPEVQQHAVEAEKRRTAEAEAQTAEQSKLTDINGTPFDPAIHEALGGVPQKTVGGVWKKKRGGAPKNGPAAPRKVNTGTDAKPAPGPNDPNAKPAPTEAEVIAAATSSAELLFAMGYIVGGDEWLPQKQKVAEGIENDERATMTAAFAGYYRAKGIADIPPGIVLTAVIVGYAAKRFSMPKTQSRWQKFKEWAYGAWGKFRGVRAARASNGEKRAEKVETVPNDAKTVDQA